MQDISNPEKKKTVRALVADGGGMRGAFTAGLLAGFRDEGVDHSFFISMSARLPAPVR